jgi:hypothetical protein
MHSWAKKAYSALVAPVTDGAWVGVVGVAIGGIITIAGTAVNGRIALGTTKTTIEGEHRQRLWEKRCAAYEETVREVLARQTRREALTSRGDPGNIGSHPIEEMRKHEEPESIRIRALLLAYASEAVWTAYEDADSVNTQFWVNLARLASTVDLGSLPPGFDYQGVLDAIYESKEDAVTADRELFDKINQELSWTPRAAPGHRRSWPFRRS